MTSVRETWSSRYGFVLATMGSAVGLGNIWRFCYVAGENGGAAFLVVYLLSVIVVGAPIVIAELALGRRGQRDTVSVFSVIAPRTIWMAAGLLGLAASFMILSFYAVISGWVAKYFVGASTGQLWAATDGGAGSYFERFAADHGETLIWQAVVLGVTMIVVLGGIKRGIERLNRVLMPLLVLILLGLAAHSLTLDGAAKGLAFLFTPQWDLMLRPDIYLAALGQAFFSLGVGMGVFITYGSYLPRRFGIPLMAGAVIIGDTAIALLAGLMIFPAVFAFGLDPKAGPELVFVTLPQIFDAMPGGGIIGALFFALLLAAALTSLVSLLEVPIAFLMYRFKARRIVATASVGLAGFIVGIPSALSFGVLDHVQWEGRHVLDSIDHVVSSYFLPVGAILTALFVGWRWARHEAIDQAGLGGGLGGRLWLLSLRFLAPILIGAVLVRTFVS